MRGSRKRQAPGRLLKLLSSIRLFIALALAVCILAILAALVPQGEAETYYTTEYGPFLSSILIRSGLSEFFRSPLLISLLAAALLNLIVCTAPRLQRSLRSLVRNRHAGKPASVARLPGADVIHLGLVVLIAASLVSIVTRSEQSFLLPTGASGVFRNQRFTVIGSEEVTGASGQFADTILDWRIHLVRTPVEDDGMAPATFSVGLNSPWSWRAFRVYFADWREHVNLLVQDVSGAQYSLGPGQALLDLQGTLIYFLDSHTDDTATLLFVPPSGESVDERVLSPGDIFGQFQIQAIDQEVVNGFRVVWNPARPAILVGLVLLGAGLMLVLLRYALAERVR